MIGLLACMARAELALTWEHFGTLRWRKALSPAFAGAKDFSAIRLLGSLDFRIDEWGVYTAVGAS
jgi:hypothetical protein